MRKTETLRFKTVLSQFNRKEALCVSQIVLSHLSASYGMQEKSEESSELLITSMQMSESERESQKRSPRMQKKMLRIQR